LIGALGLGYKAEGVVAAPLLAVLTGSISLCLFVYISISARGAALALRWL
jgi:hypothetical protein